MNRDHIETFKVYNKSTSHCLWQGKNAIFSLNCFIFLLGAQEDGISQPRLCLGGALRSFLANGI